MYPKNIYKYFIIIIVIMFPACGNKSRIDNIQSQWSGLNPTSIPLHIRLKEEQKGNLITNPSFELGKFYKIDSTNLSFVLPGWKKLGDNVSWTNTENTQDFDKFDASIGFHAIKISRQHSNETDVQGEGVITDFIRVIPGNYQLSFDIRLEHIQSNLYRLGTGVFDAVNIRVYCYDKNKVLIKNTAIHPLSDSEIDNSFKGFGFTGYEQIQKFGWSRVFGRTGNFPFEEGNLPEQTRYVRIFTGLRGEGEMWVDRVDFRYTSNNFTLLEKLEPFFDTTIERSRFLVPKPKKTSNYKEIPLIQLKNIEKQSLPAVLLPLNADKQVTDLIRQFMIPPVSVKEANNIPLILSTANANAIEKQHLIFSFGNNVLSQKYANQLPFQQIDELNHGYFIHRLNQPDNVIFIGYSDIEGLFHALHTLSQLIERESNIYHHYNITDFPDYTSRSLVFNVESNFKPDDNQLKNLNNLVSFGFNTWYARLPEMVLSASSITQATKEWMNLNIYFNGYSFLKTGISLEDLKLEGIPDGKIDSDFSTSPIMEKKISSLAVMLYDQLKELNKRNLDFVIFSDKSIWESIQSSDNGSILFNSDDFNKFLFYRAYFADYYSRLDLKVLPESYLLPYYQGIGHKGTIFSELYSNALKDSSSNKWFKKILWHGPVQGSVLIDPTDLYGYSNSSLSFIDYSLTYRSESSHYGNYYSLFPGKALTGIIFKPYDTHITGIYPEDFQNEILIKVNDLSEISMVRTATAADFLWNTSHYDPVLSLWNVLVYKYGKETAQELIIFNDLYFKLLSVSLELAKKGLNQKIERQGEEIIIQINLHWDKITTLLNDHTRFLNELTDIKNNIISRFQESRNKNEIIVNKNVTLN